jgi:GWxTD domain-containing protein
MAALFDFDVSSAPSGGYDLEVRVRQEGDSVTSVRRAHWSAAWSREAWLRNPRDVEDEVHFLLNEDQEEAFAQLDPGEQERYMDEYWSVRDPSPGSAVNEARDDYHRRLNFANRNFGRGNFVRGMFTDMGRTYVRYGEPNEVLHQVVPTGDNTLAEVLRELQLSEDRPIGDVAMKGPGGDQRPFEVWIYEGHIPLPPDADPKVEHPILKRRLLFLFVDDQGIGDYRLRYSNE